MDGRDFIAWLVTTRGIAALGRLSADDALTVGREAHAAAHARTAPHARTDAGVNVGAPRVLDARAMATVIAAAEAGEEWFAMLKYLTAWG